MKDSNENWQQALIFAIILNYLKLIPKVDVDHVSDSKVYG